MIMKCSRMGIVLAASMFLGCGMEATPPADDVNAISSDITGSFTLDFESDPTGPLPGTWSTVTNIPGSTSTASIINTADHGHVLRVHGSPVTPNYLVATFRFSNSMTDIRNAVDIHPASGASFVWTLLG